MAYDPDQYLDDHRLMWHGFLRLIAWSLAAIVVILMLMAIFLV